MRVLAVTHVLRFDELAVEGLREGQTVISAQYFRVLVDGAQIVGNHTVVGGGVFEGFQRQTKTGFVGQAVVCFQVFQHLAVVAAVYHDTHISVVFRGGTHHGWATDIDVLNRQCQMTVFFGNGGGERIEVNHDQINRVDAVFGHHIIVLTTTAQYSAVNFRMQGFYPAIHHFRETGVIRYFNRRNLVVDQQLVSTAGGQNFNTSRLQGLGEFDDSGFIRHADQGSAYRGDVRGDLVGRNKVAHMVRFSMFLKKKKRPQSR